MHWGPHAPGTALVLSAGLQTWSRAPEAFASWGEYTTWACRTGGLQNADGPACSSWDLPHRQSTHRPSGTGLALSVKIAWGFMGLRHLGTESGGQIFPHNLDSQGPLQPCRAPEAPSESAHGTR